MRPQASQSALLARPLSAVDLSFHAHLLLLGQCGRKLLRFAHPPATATRCLPLNRRPASRDQPLPRRAQPQTQTLPLDRRSRPYHGETEPWVSRVGVRPLARRLGFHTALDPKPSFVPFHELRVVAVGTYELTGTHPISQIWITWPSTRRTRNRNCWSCPSCALPSPRTQT
jgi:hypothetical protein